MPRLSTWSTRRSRRCRTTRLCTSFAPDPVCAGAVRRGSRDPLQRAFGRPGWDWTTLISLYADPETYTQQLRALEEYLPPRIRSSAAAHFVLAYQYLTEEHPEAAVRELKTVTAPPAQRHLVSSVGAAARAVAESTGHCDAEHRRRLWRSSELPPSATGGNASTGKEGKLEGTWTAQPSKDVKITLSFQGDGRFVWSVARAGQGPAVHGQIQLRERDPDARAGPEQQHDGGQRELDRRRPFYVQGHGSAAGDPGLSFSKA